MVDIVPPCLVSILCVSLATSRANANSVMYPLINWQLCYISRKNCQRLWKDLSMLFAQAVEKLLELQQQSKLPYLQCG